MTSKISSEIRKTIVKDTLQPDVPLDQKRTEWEQWVLSLPIPSGVEFESVKIAEVPCLWIHPEQSRTDCVILYVHGGGLVEGSAITTRELGSRLAKTTKISILVIDYRLAPEYPYPAALEDVTAVYRTLIDSQSYQPHQIIFGGDSNGGGLALSAILALRDEKRPLPAALFLISPVVDLTFSGESMTTRTEIDPFTSEEVLRHCAQLYAQDEPITNPLISPLFADLSSLPSTLIQVGDHEILLSDSVRLAENAGRAGCQVSLKIWESMWHVWHYFADLPEAQEALEDIRAFIDKQMP